MEENKSKTTDLSESSIPSESPKGDSPNPPPEIVIKRKRISLVVSFILFILLFLTGIGIAYLSPKIVETIINLKLPENKVVIIPTPSVTLNITPTITTEPTKSVQTGCQIGGCNSEICQNTGDEILASVCLYKPEYDCLKLAVCEKQTSGKCSWTKNEKYNQCLGSL